MRILHVIPSISPNRGGPSTAVIAIAQGLIHAGEHVEIATTDDDGVGRLRTTLGRAIMRDGVPTWIFPRRIAFYTFAPALIRWLADAISDFDVLHIHTLFSHVSVAAARIAKKRSIPYVIRPLGVLNNWGMQHRRPWLKKISLRLVERQILEAAAAVHYTSDDECRQASTLCLKQNPVVIPITGQLSSCAQDLRSGYLRNRFPQLSGKRILLFMSRIHPKKGLDLLLRSFASVCTQNTVLVIAGNGEEQFTSELHTLAVRLAVADRIVWCGFLNESEKWLALADAEIFVLPSYSENFGIAALEAMAAGVAVVVSDQVALHKDVEENAAGVVVGCDVTQLSEAIDALLSNPAHVLRLGENGRRTAQRLFSQERTTEQLMALYQSILHPA